MKLSIFVTLSPIVVGDSATSYGTQFVSGPSNRKPNCDVAAALKLDACAQGAVKNDTNSTAVQTAAKIAAKLDNLSFTPAKKPADKKNAPGKGKRVAAKKAGKKAKPTVAQLVVNQKSKKATGTCAGPAAARTNSAGGCGHGNKKPNCSTPTALGLRAICAAGAKANKAKSKEIQQAAAFAAQFDNREFTPA